METVAKAVRAAERDAEASQVARDREGATAAEMRDEEQPRGMEATVNDISLQETIATAQRILQLGKAPAETDGTSTPPVE